MIPDMKLDFYIKNNLNVLLKGRHGVGKTALILAAFERAKLKYRYFSASTMDPWCDFVGVPRPTIDPTSGKEYLDLIRPKEFAEDTVEALFFDEYSRAPKKVRNAVMELIQFKSINGKKFNNLKIIWAAVNPDDDADCQYDVEKLDPAQEDRFHVILEVPYKPYAKYFIDKFGEGIAKAAIDWWTALASDVKKLVSPRRLDYALQAYITQGDIRDVINGKGVNVTELVKVLNEGSVLGNLKKFVKHNDVKGAKAFLVNLNNCLSAIPYFVKKPEWLDFYLPLMPTEAPVSVLKSQIILNYVINNYHTGIFKKMLFDVCKSGTNKELSSKIKELLWNDKKVKIEELEEKPAISDGTTTAVTTNQPEDIVAALDAMTVNNKNWRQMYYKERVLTKLNDLRPDCSTEVAVRCLGAISYWLKSVQKRTYCKYQVKLQELTTKFVNTIKRNQAFTTTKEVKKNYRILGAVLDEYYKFGQANFLGD